MRDLAQAPAGTMLAPIASSISGVTSVTPWSRTACAETCSRIRSRLSSSNRAEHPGMASPQDRLNFMVFLPCSRLFRALVTRSGRWFAWQPCQQHGALVVALGAEEAAVGDGEGAGQVQPDRHARRVVVVGAEGVEERLEDHRADRGALADHPDLVPGAGLDDVDRHQVRRRVAVRRGPEVAKDPTEQPRIGAHGHLGTLAYDGTAVEVRAEGCHVDGLGGDPDAAERGRGGELDVEDVLGEPG